MYKRIWQFIRPYRNKLILGLFLTFLLTLLNLPMPALMMIFIDKVVGERHWEWLGWVFLTMLSVFILQGVLSFFNTYIISSIGQRILFDIRRDLYSKIHNLSIPFFDKMKTG